MTVFFACEVIAVQYRRMSINKTGTCSETAFLFFFFSRGTEYRKQLRQTIDSFSHNLVQFLAVSLRVA